MKKTITCILTSAALVLSAPSFSASLNASGNYTVVSTQKTILTNPTETKATAYEDALQLLNNLKESSPIELKQEFNVNTYTSKETNSISLKDGAYVTTQEFMNEDGKLQYKGIVNLHYQYLRRDGNS